MSRIPTVFAAAGLAALGLSAGGCVMSARTLDGMRVRLEEELPGARFEPEFQLTLGKISLGLARKLVELADAEDEEGVSALRYLERVEVAIYRPRRRPPIGGDGFAIPQERRLKKRGFELLLESRDEDGATWVFVRRDGGAL
ncbi:MAG: hypothetical protein D6696_17750, partial [Acidobacteria bacterium]